VDRQNKFFIYIISLSVSKYHILGSAYVKMDIEFVTGWGSCRVKLDSGSVGGISGCATILGAVASGLGGEAGVSSRSSSGRMGNVRVARVLARGLVDGISGGIGAEATAGEQCSGRFDGGGGEGRDSGFAGVDEDSFGRTSVGGAEEAGGRGGGVGGEAGTGGGGSGIGVSVGEAARVLGEFVKGRDSFGRGPNYERNQGWKKKKKLEKEKKKEESKKKSSRSEDWRSPASVESSVGSLVPQVGTCWTVKEETVAEKELREALEKKKNLGGEVGGA